MPSNLLINGRVLNCSKSSVCSPVPMNIMGDLVAATALSRPDVVRGALDVTGPEALTLAEAARRLAPLAGRQLRYEDESVAAGRAWRAQLGAPDWEVDTWLGSYEAIGAGELAAPSDAVARLTGRAPESLESYFARNPQLLAPLRAQRD